MKQKIFFSVMLILAVLAAAVGCSAPAPDYSAQEILDAIKAAYGDDYLPETALSQEELTQAFGLDMSLVEDFAAEMPMISFHPDRVVIIKAVEGQGEAVEQALTSARENLLENAFFYPANLPKVNASKVVRNGDYVAFLMVGAVDDVSQTEEEMAQFAEAEVQKGVDAFNALFA